MTKHYRIYATGLTGREMLIDTLPEFRTAGGNGCAFHDYWISPEEALFETQRALIGLHMRDNFDHWRVVTFSDEPPLD